MKLTARQLLSIDRWFSPLNRLVRGRNYRAGLKKTGSGDVAIIKLMGLGSIIRLLSLCHESNVDLSRVILITFASNREACRLLKVDRALFIRTDSALHFVRDCIAVLFSVVRIKPYLIIDFERCSNSVALYRRCLSIAGGSSTLGFDEFITVSTTRHTVFNVNAFTFHQMLLRGIECMQKKVAGEPAKKSRENSSKVVVNINCSEYLLARRYPRDLFKALIVKLNHRMENAIFYLTGAASERAYVEELASALHQSGVRIHNVAGKWTLTELYGILLTSRLFVSGDSGPLHLAIYLGVPTLAIWGPTRPQHFGYVDTDSLVNVSMDLPCAPCFTNPHSTPAVACKGKITCLSELSPEAILLSADRLLLQIPQLATW